MSVCRNCEEKIGGYCHGCMNNTVDTLTAQLAERDGEIALLRQQSVGWVQVFDENAALRAEVERLREQAAFAQKELADIRRLKMSSFDSWYEGYERDGCELMLFNTIDLEAAYKAGMLRAAEIAEERYNKIPLVDEVTCDEAAYAIRRETEDGEPN